MTFARIAVPLFMLITGFFYSDVIARSKEKNQIKKFFIIAVDITVLYIFFDCVQHFLLHNFDEYFAEIFNVRNLVNFLLFNDPIQADHGWYMWAMIYVLEFVYLFPCLYKNKLVKGIIIAAGLILMLVCGKYSLLFFGREIASTYTRNAWVVGFPYFLLGITIREMWIELQYVKSYTWCVLAIVSTALCFLERALLIHFQLNAARDHIL